MMGSVLPETCRDLLQVKYILISCIKLVFLFIIIWCTETQNWKILSVFAVCSKTVGRERFSLCIVVNVIMSFVFHVDYCRRNRLSFGLLRSETECLDVWPLRKATLHVLESLGNKLWVTEEQKSRLHQSESLSILLDYFSLKQVTSQNSFIAKSDMIIYHKTVIKGFYSLLQRFLVNTLHGGVFHSTVRKGHRPLTARRQGICLKLKMPSTQWNCVLPKLIIACTQKQ